MSWPTLVISLNFGKLMKARIQSEHGHTSSVVVVMMMNVSFFAMSASIRNQVGNRHTFGTQAMMFFPLDKHENHANLRPVAFGEGCSKFQFKKMSCKHFQTVLVEAKLNVPADGSEAS